MDTVTRRPLNLTDAIELIRQDAIVYRVTAKKGDLWSESETVADSTDSLNRRFGRGQVFIPTMFNRLRSRPLLFVARAMQGIREEAIQELNNRVDVWIG